MSEINDSLPAPQLPDPKLPDPASEMLPIPDMLDMHPKTDYRRRSLAKEYVRLEKGLLPPQAVELEEVVLGALMIDVKAANEIMPFMSAEVFYKEAHQRIFEAIAALYEQGEKIDLLTVSNQLKITENLDRVGGEFYLVQLTQKVASGAHIEFHCRILMQKYCKRRLIRLGSLSIEDAYSESSDIFDIMDEIQTDLTNIQEVILKGVSGSVISVTEQVMEKRKQSQAGQLLYMPTQMSNMDDHISGGFVGSELTVIGARPGMGKTTLALILAKTFSMKSRFKGGFFSLEMPKLQVTNKLIAPYTGMPYSKIKNIGRLNDQEFYRLMSEYERFEKEGNVHVIDNISTIPGIYNWVQQNNPHYIMVDYLQLLSLESKVSKKIGNREQEISYFSRNLKRIAKEFDIPVFAMSQLSRKVDDRPGRRPRLSDLRESGAIEQDADRVAFVVRPNYYEDSENVPAIEAGNTIIDFAKDRDNGPGVFYTNLDMINLDMRENFRLAGDITPLPGPTLPDPKS